MDLVHEWPILQRAINIMAYASKVLNKSRAIKSDDLDDRLQKMNEKKSFKNKYISRLNC